MSDVQKPRTLNQILEDIEVACIHAALSDAHGCKSAAARMLGITRKNLWQKIKKYQLTPAAREKGLSYE